MNVIVRIDRRSKARNREEIPEAYKFTERIDELTKTGALLFYGENTIGGTSAIIEVD